MRRLFLLVLMSSMSLAGRSQQLCLNKYTLDEAKTMVSNFESGNTVKPKPTYVWFNKSVIENILTLLRKEKTPGGKGADGIRVYFGAMKTGNVKTNTVILVSTYAKGLDFVPSLHKHKNYFNHDPDDPLFKTPNIYGEPCSEPSCQTGALLYQDCGSCPNDSNCDPFNLHSITRKYGQGMVSNFGSDLVVSKSEWFDLKMISDIDSEMKLVENYDGMRFYFARHKKVDLISHDKDAFVIEATTSGADGTHTDYFDCNRAQLYFKQLYFNKHKKELNELLVKYLRQNGFNINKISANKLAKLKAKLLSNGFDNGELCPTHCQVPPL